MLRGLSAYVLALLFLCAAITFVNAETSSNQEGRAFISQSVVNYLFSKQMQIWFSLPLVVFTAVLVLRTWRRFRGRSLVTPATCGWIGFVLLLLAANTFLAYVALGFDDMKPNGDYLSAVLLLALGAITFLIVSSLGFLRAANRGRK